MGLLSSTLDNEVLSADEITPQSPASIVVKLLWERMFGGVTDASDPRLLTLTGLLAYNTREQVAFRSRTREELGDTIREMLLMVICLYFVFRSVSFLPSLLYNSIIVSSFLQVTGVFTEIDARDRTLRSIVDRQIEEVCLEENLVASGDARG